MKVNVIINAIFGERFVKEQMELNLSKEATLKELFSEVKKRSGLDLRKLDGKGLTIMLSGRRLDFPADLETPLCDGVQLSVLSPIAGG